MPTLDCLKKANELLSSSFHYALRLSFRQLFPIKVLAINYCCFSQNDQYPIYKTSQILSASDEAAIQRSPSMNHNY